jgi:AraC-like DNA-binding protein
MIEINLSSFSVSSWLQNLAEQLGAEIIDEKIILIPECIGKGSFFITEVVPGLSVVIWDLVFKENIDIKVLKEDSGLFVVHYDFSDDLNLIMVDGTVYKFDYKANLGMGVFNAAFESLHHPKVGERIYAMRLLVSKKILNVLTSNCVMKMTENKIKSGKKTLCFFDHIDSKSRILLQNIKSRSIFDPAFEIYLRGISFRLLSKFIDRYYNLEPSLYLISKKEADLVTSTKDYLMENLLNNFVGIHVLADMAGMSVTKYKSLFKKMFMTTPNGFFIQERMILAKKLLKSKNFYSIAEIAAELKFHKIGVFNLAYFKYYGVKPCIDFIALEDVE